MRNSGPPRYARVWIRLLLDEEDRSSVLGDLEEVFASLEAKRGRTVAATWYWKEAIVIAMYAVVRGLKRQIATIVSIVLGVAGGAGLIAVASTSTRGSRLLVVYAAVMLLLGVCLSIARVEAFGRRFALVLTAFMTMTLLMNWFVAAGPSVAPLPLWAHAWRIGFSVAFGSLTALIVAAFSSRTSSPFLIFPTIPAAAIAALAVGFVPQPHRAMFQGVLPFTLFVNWRHDGWAWAFAGLDVCLWAAIGWIAFQLWRRLHPQRVAAE